MNKLIDERANFVPLEPEGCNYENPIFQESRFFSDIAIFKDN